MCENKYKAEAGQAFMPEEAPRETKYRLPDNYLKSEEPYLDLDHVFSYHAPAPWQLSQFELIRSAAKTLAAVIEANTPRCADQQAAIRHVREAVMTANAAIALQGRLSR